MALNIPLLRKSVEWVETQEQLAGSKRHWFQGSWTKKLMDHAQQDLNDPYCGSAMCVAGKVSFDAGWKPVWYEEDDGGTEYADNATKNGVEMSIDLIARNELGITYEQSEALFAGYNDASDIRRVAESIAGQRL